MKLDFFTHISHEIRTPLTLVIGPVEMLMKKLSGCCSTVKAGRAYANDAREALIADHAYRQQSGNYSGKATALQGANAGYGRKTKNDVTRND